MEVADIENVLRENIKEQEVHGFLDYMANLIKEEPPNVSRCESRMRMICIS